MRPRARWLRLVLPLLAALLLFGRRATPAPPALPPLTSLKPAWGTLALMGVVLLAYGGTLLVRQQRSEAAVARALTGGADISQAPALLRKYGCGGCHTISGVPGADGQVGGSLDGLRRRVFIGGVVRNAPDALVAWIVAPQTFSPATAMPRTGITPEEARAVAAFLYRQ